jgi:Tol biopolymer transport system component
MYMLGVTNGTPELYALQTGAKLTTPAFGGGRYTHPDWSPDGTSVVAVRVTGQFNSDMGFTGGELVKIPFTDGAFGTPVTLVPAVSGKNLYYPAWSPDGAWIAYNRSTGDSYADGDAEVWLSTADGTRQIRLDTINDGGVQNSYPRWGPLPDDDVLWLAFSSKRDYAPSQTSFPQIWISAIDPTLAEQGLDPSFAPFWLPGQDVRSDNHLPAWWSR